MINKRTLVFFGLISLALIGAGVAFAFESRDTTPTIVMRDDGFHPKKLVVPSGATVKFVNKSSHPFWPASDNHPLHDLYVGFDVGRPVDVGKSWSFTFAKDGVWTLHDHLRPYFRGTIAVGDVDPNETCLDKTSGMNIAEKQSCWERELSNTLEDKGAVAAFTLFKQLYGSDPDFSEQVGCHLMAHKLGEAEYAVYLKHHDLSKLEFPPETVYCGYGYYHGFIEHFLRDNPNYNLADNFCKTLISNLQEDVPRIRLNCYHSIGHGFVPEPDDVEKWGNPVLMVQPAITACYNIKENDALHECLQGTFNVIADWMWNFQFGLYVNKKDPLSICKLFSDNRDVSSACYYEVSMRLNPLADSSIIEAYRLFASKIPDPIIAGTVINSVAASAVGQRILDSDLSDLVLECRQLPESLQTDCMKGLTGAFVAHGEPEKEYVKALNFCSMNMLTDKEKDTCYWNIIRTFKGAYTKEKVGEICKLIEAPYQKYCSYDVVYE